MNVDATAVRAGALADLAVLVPVVAVYSLLRALGALHGDAGVAVTAAVAVFVAPLLGGIVAGRRSRATPLTNAAVATAIAVLVYVAFRAVDALVRNRPLSFGDVVILIMLSTLVGLLGGLIGSFRRSGGTTTA